MLQNKVGVQNLFKLLGRSSLALLLLTSSLLFAEAGSFEDFKRVQSYSFENYKEENDQIFVELLKEQWEAYFAEQTLMGYEEKKPREIYPARQRIVKGQGPKVNIRLTQNNPSRVDPSDLNETIDSQNNIVIIPIKQDMREELDAGFDFFGTAVSFNVPEGIEHARFYPQTTEGIGNFYNLVSRTPYENLLKKINDLSADLSLNDWGKYLLVKMMSETVFKTQDEARLLSWFLFNKLGYDVKVALKSNHVLVLYRSERLIYATPNYQIDKKRYYLLSDYAKTKAAKVFTYKKNYPDANKPIDLSMKDLPRFVKDMKDKTLLFKDQGMEYRINYSYNQNLLDFMHTYPQADYDTFFNTPLYEESYNDIARELKKHLNGKQATIALNFVLRFVQTAFKYEVDTKQFGREKVMFADETLFYEKSDCEDRAILFSQLVKRLFDIDVVGVKYTDHMATALYIPIQGDSVKLNSKRYVIADPTYINASIGQSMPKYKRKRPQSFVILKL